jgi:HPt (histidine-containing phosphotransfer) domain-containing protein
MYGSTTAHDNQPLSLPNCLDAGQVATLYGTDLPLLQRCIRSYCSSLEHWHTLYQHTVTAQNIETARTLAHKLKGAAANLGDPKLAALAATQEQAHRCGEWGDTRQLLSMFGQHLLLLKAWIDAQAPCAESNTAERTLDSSAMLQVLSELKPMLERHAFIDAAMIERLQPLLQSGELNTEAEKLQV